LRVDVACAKCGARTRLDIGTPAAGQSTEEYLHLLRERLTHRPSFQCFGGHFETRAPVPEFWQVDWETVGD
jgi:hypothetical protein